MRSKRPPATVNLRLDNFAGHQQHEGLVIELFLERDPGQAERIGNKQHDRAEKCNGGRGNARTPEKPHNSLWRPVRPAAL